MPFQLDFALQFYVQRANSRKNEVTHVSNGNENISLFLLVRSFVRIRTATSIQKDRSVKRSGGGAARELNFFVLEEEENLFIESKEKNSGSSIVLFHR